MFNPEESDGSNDDEEEERATLTRRNSSSGCRRSSSFGSGSLGLGNRAISMARSMSVSRVSIKGDASRAPSIRGSTGLGSMKSAMSMRRQSSVAMRRMSSMSGGRESIALGGNDPLGSLLAEEERQNQQSPRQPLRTPCEAAAEAASDHPACVRLPLLRVLDLSSNQLLALPPWLPPSLISLFMSHNTLASIPDWAATRLVNLQVGGQEYEDMRTKGIL